ncbi:MAG TPA: Ig-like domain-containing protein, partial [Prolixibacteraceae bacterium]|nr:Ig-like domain-containing protein [Prolixibacteraceae bacterium]
VGYENSLITGNVGTNDFDFLEQEFKLIYTLKGDPPEGLTFFDNGAYEYQPPQGFIGKVNFSYRVCFEQVPESCAGSDVELRILPNNPVGNIAPVASTDAALTFPGKTVNSNLVVNDIDPDGFGGALIVGTNPVNGPANGSVVINTNGTFSYTPDVGFIGIDRFLYQVCDNGNEPECDSAWVYIIVSQFGGNGQKPVSASDDMFLYVENTEYSLRENDYGLLGENLVYNTSPEIDVAHGSLQLYPDGTFFYTPDEGYYGVDWFIYSVCNTEENPVCRKGTGFILVTREKQFISLAGRDTTIGTCAPFTLNATHLGEGFNYLWQPGELLDDSTSRTPVFTPGNSTLFKLTVTNQFGFESKDSVKVVVLPVIADAGEETFMYRNQEAVLDGSASSGAGLQFYWSTENGNIKSGENTSHPVIDKFGTYYLQVTDAFGCVALDTVLVGLLTYSPVAQNDYDSADYQSGVKIYVLDNDYDPENDIDSLSLLIQRPPFNGTASIDYTDFTVNYMPNKGFSGTDELEYQICDTFINCDNANVFIVVAESRFFIPDAFSPNNDGINDYFEILGIGLYEGNSLEIFNRWGNRVYRADNYGISTSPLFWDGKSNTGFTFGNDDLPSGTYFYVLNLGNGEKRIVGSVYLDR